jgi:hypothetical protein
MCIRLEVESNMVIAGDSLNLIKFEKRLVFYQQDFPQPLASFASYTTTQAASREEGRKHRQVS